MAESPKHDLSELAINGGPRGFDLPKMEWPFPNPAVEQSVHQALADGSWGRYEGVYLERLTERIQSFFQRSYVQLCSSGTIAVELALRGAGVKSGDEVILAAYDFPGNFRAIEAIGARPVLVDVVENGWVINPSKLASAFSEQTKAILVSHIHGQVADVPAIRKNLASCHPSVCIVEDNCQMPGGMLAGQRLGSFGDIATLSFGGSKLLTAGRGGAVMTNKESMLQRAKIFANRGNDAFPLSQLQAAALLPQFAMLDQQNDRRQIVVQNLFEKTDNLPGLESMKQIVQDDRTPGFYKVAWLWNASTHEQKATTWDREDLIAAFQAEGLPIDSGFRGFAGRSTRRCRTVGELVNAKRAAAQTMLMHHPVLLQSDDTLDQLFRAIKKVVTSI